MIRTKGEAGTGDVSQAVKHMKQIMGEIRALSGKTREELIMVAREIEAPIELVVETAKMQRLPVVNFAAGGIATPTDAALIFIHYIGIHICECARPSHNCELDNIFKELRIKGY